MNDQDLLELAMAHHRAGKLAQAEQIYRGLLARHPGHGDLLHLLGVVAHHSGRLPEARQLMQQAIAANLGRAHYYSNFGLLLMTMGDVVGAAEAFQRAIALEPGLVEAHYNLGNLYSQRGDTSAAIDCYRAAIARRPDYADAYINLANSLVEQKIGAEAEAVSVIRAGLVHTPHHSALWNNLGNLLKDSADLDGAVAAYERALACGSNEAVVANNLGAALAEVGNPDAAEQAYRKALEWQPYHAIAASNLGGALKDQGRLSEAIAMLRQSLALNPDDPGVHSNLILTLHYDPTASRHALPDELAGWRRRFADPLKSSWQAHLNSPDPDRRLRIGYISPDLRDHVVGRTFLPIFQEHDSDAFEVVCYSEAANRDTLAERFKAAASLWRQTTNVSDDELAAQIRADGVDLLVDLALHTSHNRLLVLARKAAPVQFTWLGYPGTTGLDAIDYAITDPQLDPEGLNEDYYSETLVRLPHTWCCYPAEPSAPEPGDLPALTNGYVTFGSCNNLCKLNEQVLELWAEILARVPRSRLRLLAKAGRHQERIREFFERRGLGGTRLEFMPYIPVTAVRPTDPPQHRFLARYQEIDVALDPFPYNGMTTTGDALWMGIPVVALMGTLPISRASYSMLTTVGLPDLAAPSSEGYVEVAVRLANDLPRVSQMRRELRSRMRASPLCDPGAFTRRLEAAYRTAWRTWCAR